MQRITERQQLVKLAKELGVRPSWHEPDEQGVTAVVRGKDLDNAGFWPHPRALEMYIELRQESKPVAAINLATLLAWASQE